MASVALIVVSVWAGGGVLIGDFLTGIQAEPAFNVLGACASAAAIAGFVPWALQQRRRPEVRMLWKIAEGESEEALTVWAHGTMLEVRGGPVIVEASVLNVGDATAVAAQSNFVVPDMVGLESLRPVEPRPTRVVPADGADPGVRFVADESDITPGNWWMQRFKLSLPGAPGETFRLRFVLSQGRLNVSGRRSVPSRLTDGDIPETGAGTPWPPDAESARWWHWSSWRRATAQPDGQLLCRRGVRADVRDLRVVDPRPAG